MTPTLARLSGTFSSVLGWVQVESQADEHGFHQDHEQDHSRDRIRWSAADRTTTIRPNCMRIQVCGHKNMGNPDA